MSIRLEQPRRAIRIVVEQLLIFFRAEIASPHNAGMVDVGGVVNPFLKQVLWAIAYKNQLPAGLRVELPVDGDAALRVAMIDSIPGFIGRHRSVEFFIAGSVHSIPEEKVRGAEK